ncbi:MAG: RNA polymerase-binding protein DksA [Candidatus Binataceae bacterium]
MRQRELKMFRQLLEARRRIIFSEAERALGTLNSGVDDGCPDPTDRASLEADRSFLLRMRDRERKLLSKIDEAFARLDGGTYGVCEDCGGTIGVERLKARPVTTLCIGCKSAQEARERQG